MSKQNLKKLYMLLVTKPIAQRLISLLGLILFLTFSLSGYSQDLLVNFYPGSDTVNIESVRVVNLSNNTIYSMNPEDALHIVEATDVRFLAESQNQFEIYPNPADESFFIQFAAVKSGVVNLCLSDAGGRQIFSDSFYAVEGYHKLEVTGNIQGLYFVSLRGDSYLYSGKVAGISNSGSGFKASLIQSVEAEVGETILTKDKAQYEMPYTYGDVLIFTFLSDIGNTTIIPFTIENADEYSVGDVVTLTVNFYSCKDYEEFEYPVVEAGEQVWMAQNLNTAYFNDNNSIKMIDSDNTWSQLTTVAYCDYDNSPANSEIFGKLYNWHAVNYSGGICPQGWHVSTDADWLELENHLSVSVGAVGTLGWRGEPAGCLLKQSGTEFWESDPGENTNYAGFFALPGGMRTLTGEFSHINNYGAWWTATASDNKNAWCRALRADSCDIYREDGYKTLGLSVRCVYDEKSDTIPVEYLLATLSNVIVSGVTGNTASLEAGVTDDGGTAVTEFGFVWNTTGDPVLGTDNHIANTSSDPSLFNSEISGLLINTVYYVRAYAVNFAGVSYSNSESFTTLSSGAIPATISDVIGSNILMNSFTLEAGVTDDGGSAVTEFGFVWNTTGNPVILVDNQDINTTDEAILFNSDITGLLANTTYYVRAYAINIAGVAYSNTETITTLNVGGTTAALSDVSGSNILMNSIFLLASVTDDGGSAVTEFGFVWNTTGNPVVLVDNQEINTTDEAVLFDSEITGLSAGADYYVKAYAINGIGVAYSDTYSFTTLAAFFTSGAGVTDVDGNVYPTVIINGKEYMSENLRTANYNNGTSLDRTDNALAWSSQANGAYCWSENDSTAYEELFGKLYNYAAINSGILCPIGWHVPTDEDWKDLEKALGMDATQADEIGWRGDNQGGMLKETGLANWLTPNAGATNQSGMNVLPTGYRDPDGTFRDIGSTCYYWSMTPNLTASTGYSRMISSSEQGVYRGEESMLKGISVRCMKDVVNPAITVTQAVSEITTNSLISGGNIVDDGGGIISQRGLVWGTSPLPDLTTNEGFTNNGTGSGIYRDTVYGLTPNTAYHIRAYAINEAGESYGPDIFVSTLEELFTPGSGVTDIDGNFYNTVLMGSTEYMTSNLRTSRLNDGAPILRANNSSEWSTSWTSLYCWYNDDSLANEVKNGRLYNHVATSTGNLCPTGWHVPSDSEWKQLEFYLGMSATDTSNTGWRGDNQGAMLKEWGPANWTATNVGATNQSGFSATGSGYRNSDGSFAGEGEYFATWTATMDISFMSWARKLMNSEITVYRGVESDGSGFSVRCIKTPITAPVVVTGAVTDISVSTAVCHGTITQDGWTEITEKGIVWNTVGNPTVINYDGITTEGPGSGEIMSVIYDLEPSTSYYIRTYATNAVGTSYGDEISFNTLAVMFAPGPGVSDPDGNVYETVILNNQEWMASNLRSQSFMQAKSGSAKDTVINENLYGRLYSSFELQQGGRCPVGWYVANEDDWRTLEIFLGVDEAVVDNMGWRGTTEGGKLKEPGFLSWVYPNTGATNETGFNFRAAGYFDENDNYIGEGEVCRYWTSGSEPVEPYYSYARELSFDESRINKIAADPNSMYYVRCVKPATLPTLITKPVTVNAFYEHFSGGIIVLPGSSAIFSKGVVWAMDPNPTLMNYTGFTDEGAGTNDYSSELYGIAPGQTYYLRAYAVNNDGTAYGNTISFVGTASVQQMLDFGIRPLAIVNMGIPVDSLYGKYFEEGFIISLDADGGGLLCSTSDYGTADWGCTGSATGAVGTQYGLGLYNTVQIMDACLMSMIAAQNCRYYSSGSYFDWYMPTRDELLLMFQNSQYITGISTTPYWTSTESTTQPQMFAVCLSEGNIIEAPKSQMYNLRPVRHFAADPVYDIDGNYYPVLRIGTQSWLGENLKTSRFQNGDPIYYAGNSTDWMLNTGNVSYCYPQDDPFTGLGYGILYNYNVVTDPRNVCPEGWHVPSDTEWDVLVNFLGGDLVAGGKLKSPGDSFWAVPNQSATNITSFGALPLGNRSETDGLFNFYYEHAYYWTSSPQDPFNSWYRSLQYDHGMVMHNTANIGAGMNVRCVKD